MMVFRPALAWAEPNSSVLAPIETKMNLGFLGVLGGSMEYSLGGERISRYEDFKKLIYPLHDMEASDMIRESETDHFAAMVLYTTGLAAGLDLALVYHPNPLFRVDWLDRIVTGLIGVQVFTGLGSLFDANAEGHKYNAVQRYNQLIREPKSVYLDLTPQLSPSNHGLNLVISMSY